MHCGNSQDVPPIHRLSDDLADLLLNDVVVCLVFEVGDTLLALRVITDCAEEQRDGATPRPADEFNEVPGVDQIGTDRNEYIVPSGLAG